MSGRPQAVPTVQVDNAEVIVTEWRFAPGAETGRHRHGHDYVVVPLTDGTLLLETPEGDRHAPLVAGRAAGRRTGLLPQGRRRAQRDQRQRTKWSSSRPRS